MLPGMWMFLALGGLALALMGMGTTQGHEQDDVQSEADAVKLHANDPATWQAVANALNAKDRVALQALSVKVRPQYPMLANDLLKKSKGPAVLI